MATPQSTAIQKARNYSDVVFLQDASTFDDFIKEPASFIAQVVTGILSGGMKGIAVSGGRLVQGILKARLFEQFGREFKQWQDTGKISADFAEKKYGFQTWVELMTIIDQESPDEDRLEALKAMFLAVNRPDINDHQRILEYQLWNVTKQLNSGELLLLKHIYQDRGTLSHIAQGGYYAWANALAKSTGFGVNGLVDLYQAKLVDLFLITQRQHADGSGVSTSNGRLTEFGLRLSANIETYTHGMTQPKE
ncbi:MAG TPA: hypothetical protein VGN16_17605 [Acidobacteriaceae bacterium]|jgi:hypothetical protein